MTGAIDDHRRAGRFKLKHQRATLQTLSLGTGAGRSRRANFANLDTDGEKE
jgi:hypothetical protein